jgi:hypothetical protein
MTVINKFQTSNECQISNPNVWPPSSLTNPTLQGESLPAGRQERTQCKGHFITGKRRPLGEKLHI